MLLASVLPSLLLIGQTNGFAELELVTSVRGGLLAQPGPDGVEGVAGIPSEFVGTEALDWSFNPRVVLGAERREQLFELGYSPSLFYREADGAVDEVLVRHVVDARHEWRALPRLTWSNVAALDFGETPGVLGGPEAPVDGGQVPEPNPVEPVAQVVEQLRFNAESAFDGIASERLSWRLAGNVSLFEPQGEIEDQFQGTLQVGAFGGLRYALSRRTNTLLEVEGRYIDITDQDQTILTGAGRVGLEYLLSRRWKTEVAAGAVAVERLDVDPDIAALIQGGSDVFPSARLQVSFRQAPRTRVQYGFAVYGVLDGVVDQSVGDLRPRMQVGTDFDAIFDQDWILTFRVNFGTNVIDGPRPLAIDEDGNPTIFNAFETQLTGGLGLQRNFGPQWAVVLGVDGSLRGPHLDIGEESVLIDGVPTPLDPFQWVAGGVSGNLSIRYLWSSRLSARERNAVR
ncbi:MAG: hypothetical protein ACFB9M_18450 [Myxococcota bacterium]